MLSIFTWIHCCSCSYASPALSTAGPSVLHIVGRRRRRHCPLYLQQRIICPLSAATYTNVDISALRKTYAAAAADVSTFSFSFFPSSFSTYSPSLPLLLSFFFTLLHSSIHLHVALCIISPVRLLLRLLSWVFYLCITIQGKHRCSYHIKNLTCQSFYILHITALFKLSAHETRREWKK